MKNNKKTNEQLLIEIEKLNDKIADLDKSVTKFKQPQKALQESEEKYRAIFEEANYGILHVNEKLKVLNVNPAFTEITGISEETVVGKTGFDLARKFVNLKQLPQILNIIKSTISNKPVKPYELNYKDKILEVFPRKQESGNTIGIIRDITERKNAEETLQESKNNFQDLVENLQDGVAILGGNGYFVYVNPKFSEITGYSNDELLKMNGLDFARGKDKAKLKQRMKDRMAGKKMQSSFDRIIVRKDGTELLVEMSASTTNWQGKKLPIAIIHDITKRKHAEKEITKLSKVIETSSQAMVITNVQGEVIYVNDSLLYILGFNNEQEVLGKSMFDFTDEDGICKLNEEIIPSILSTGHWQGEINNKRKDGTLFPAEEVCSITKNEKGEHEYYIAVFMDITERKLAEDRIKESEEKLRNFIEFTPLGIWCFQLEKPIDINIPEDQMIAEFFNSICVECNDTYASMMGVSKEEIIGLKLSDAMPNTDENRDYLRNFIKNEFKLSGGISRELTKDGKEKYFSNSMVAVIKNSKLINAWGTQADVTDRMQAEEALQDSEKRFKYLVENSNDVIVIIDESGKEVYVSDSVERITGFSPTDVLGHSSFEFLHPDDVDHMSKTLSKLLKTQGVTFKDEYRHKRKGGGWVYLEAIGTNYLHEPSIKGIVLNVRDITERKKMEIELIRLSDVFKMSIDSIVISNLDGIITDVNEATLKMYCTDNKADFLGKSSFDFIAPEDKEKAIAGMKEVMEKGYVKNKEYQIIIKDGSKIPVEMSTSIMKGIDGDPIGVVGVTRDVTEQKKAGETLRESEKKFKDMANLLPQIIYEHDINGNITFANNRGFELFGYSIGDLKKGINIQKILLPEDRDRAKKNNEILMTGKQPRDHEFTLLRKDGSTFPVLIYTSLILKENKPVGIRGTIVDITKRKQTEEKLMNRNKELETFNEVTVGRELKMLELKKEINEFLEKSGKKPKYEIPV